jgi:CheY-like chemotaxis protein
VLYTEEKSGMSSKPKRAKGVVVFTQPRIMIADDDAEFLEGAKDYLASCDIEVKTAQTPEEATRLLEEDKLTGKNGFDVVASDVNFGELSDTKGDEFVRNSKELIGETRPVLFSGEISTEEVNRLERKGYEVLAKQEDLTEKLAELVHAENGKKADEIEEVLKQETAPRVLGITGRSVSIIQRQMANTPLDTMVYQRLKRTFVKWLQSRTNPDELVLAYGKQVYSAKDMISEIEGETEAGVEHVRMMLNVFENSLGINLDDDDEDDDSYQIENVSQLGRTEHTGWKN